MNLFASIKAGLGKLGHASALAPHDAAGTPGGWAREPGTGGALAANGPVYVSSEGEYGELPASLVPAGTAPRRNGGWLERAPDASAPAGGGWLTRAKTPGADGYSKLDRWGQLGATMRDQMTGGNDAARYDARAAGQVAQRRNAALNAQIDALYPNDERMRFALKADPEAAIAHMLKLAEPMKLGATERLVGPGGQVQIDALPDYEDAGGFAFDPRTGTYGGKRPENYMEANARRRLDELDIPHFDRADDTARYSAETGRIGVNNTDARARATEARLARGGNPTGGGPVSSLSDAQLMQFLRGGR